MCIKVGWWNNSILWCTVEKTSNSEYVTTESRNGQHLNPVTTYADYVVYDTYLHRCLSETPTHTHTHVTYKMLGLIAKMLSASSIKLALKTEDLGACYDSRRGVLRWLTQALLSKPSCLIAEYLIACNEARTVQQTSVKWLCVVRCAQQTSLPLYGVTDWLQWSRVCAANFFVSLRSTGLAVMKQGVRSKLLCLTAEYRTGCKEAGCAQQTSLSHCEVPDWL